MSALLAGEPVADVRLGERHAWTVPEVRVARLVTAHAAGWRLDPVGRLTWEAAEPWPAEDVQHVVDMLIGGAP